MSVEIVKPAAELIPTKDLSNYAQSINELAESTEKLVALGEQAKQFTSIKDKDEYKKAAAVLADVRSIKKHGEQKVGPYLDLLNQAAKHVRQYRTDYEEKVAEIEDFLVPHLAEFNRLEAEAAKKEEDAKNDQLRKEAAEKAAEAKREADKKADEERQRQLRQINTAARSGEIGKREAVNLKKKVEETTEQAKQDNSMQAKETVFNAPQVRVRPDVPHQSGLRKVTNWFWEMVDITQVPREKLYPNKDKDGKYDTAKFPKITELVKETKDKAKAEKACPGIRVWSKDRV